MPSRRFPCHLRAHLEYWWIKILLYITVVTVCITERTSHSLYRSCTNAVGLYATVRIKGVYRPGM